VKPPLTPGESAGADQLAATAGDVLDTIVIQVALGDARQGEAQNLADQIAYLARKHDAASLAAIVVVAARRLGARTEA